MIHAEEHEMRQHPSATDAEPREATDTKKI
jgi:hypothetical protein